MGDLEQFEGGGGGVGGRASGGSLSSQTGGAGIIPIAGGTSIGGGGNYQGLGGGVGPNGGTGGFGGGGGGGTNGGGSGNGGFGGGGGAGNGDGGFGGGAGGGQFNTGGFGAGKGGELITGPDDNAYAGGGGGGLGAGADVFVQQGGQLIIGDVALNAGTVTGGAAGSTNAGKTGSTKAIAGSGYGNGIFIEGNNTITFAPPSGTTTVVSSVIADQRGSVTGAHGAGSVILNGAGTLDLAIAEPYSGDTKIKGGGTLELAVPTGAGTGDITFAGNGSLRIDTLAAPTNKIIGFGTNNTIDLVALPFMTGATATIKNNALVVTSGGQTVTLGVQSKDATLYATKDVSGGTLISRFFPVVTNETQLNTELALLAGSTTADRIAIGASFALTTPLLVINLGAGGSLTIDGGGFALNGAGTQRGLLVYSGNVTINNLALNNMAAIGGIGGTASNPGGGGAGLGGGLLIAAGGNVTLNNVSFADDRAIGGAGGSYFNGGFAGGGGGGLGGNGGDGFFGGPLDFTTDGGGGGLGLGANGGKQDVNDGQGGTGIAPGAASGGKGSGGTPGGINGGGGGDAPRGDGGGGGIGGQNGNSAGNFGGNGGFGGGGGGGGGGLFDKTLGGGNGGFGGGAGGGSNSTHSGGFGGGGAGGGDSRGVPGSGGGSGGGSNNGGGGGGAGFGADILVQQRGTLTIGSGTLDAGTVAGGAGGSRAHVDQWRQSRRRGRQRHLPAGQPDDYLCTGEWHDANHQGGDCRPSSIPPGHRYRQPGGERAGHRQADRRQHLHRRNIVPVRHAGAVAQRVRRQRRDNVRCFRVAHGNAPARLREARFGNRQPVHPVVWCRCLRDLSSRCFAEGYCVRKFHRYQPHLQGRCYHLHVQPSCRGERQDDHCRELRRRHIRRRRGHRGGGECQSVGIGSKPPCHDLRRRRPNRRCRRGRRIR